MGKIQASKISLSSASAVSMMDKLIWPFKIWSDLGDPRASKGWPFCTCNFSAFSLLQLQQLWRFPMDKRLRLLLLSKFPVVPLLPQSTSLTSRKNTWNHSIQLRLQGPSGRWIWLFCQSWRCSTFCRSWWVSSRLSRMVSMLKPLLQDRTNIGTLISF